MGVAEEADQVREEEGVETFEVLAFWGEGVTMFAFRFSIGLRNLIFCAF